MNVVRPGTYRQTLGQHSDKKHHNTKDPHRHFGLYTRFLQQRMVKQALVTERIPSTRHKEQRREVGVRGEEEWAKRRVVGIRRVRKFYEKPMCLSGVAEQGKRCTT